MASDFRPSFVNFIKLIYFYNSKFDALIQNRFVQNTEKILGMNSKILRIKFLAGFSRLLF